jgi:hypothetical protein
MCMSIYVEQMHGQNTNHLKLQFAIIYLLIQETAFGDKDCDF